MKPVFILLVLTFVIQNCVAPPITKELKEDVEVDVEVEAKEELPDDVEYRRYLEEVIYALESDPEFRQKLEKANETDIRNGNIADELEYVNHKVRTKLDELKRAELERLRHLAVREYELENGLDPSHMKINEHLDHTNPHTFEINDLKKLIAKTTKDLDEADRRRREEFKQYEMHKKFEQEEKMKQMNSEEKHKFEAELQDLEKKHKDHEPLHHPGSKKQLEEVWKKQDHMEYQQFDPRTFFFLHDLDGNGVWDQNELKTLFLKELDKLYAEGHPEDDLVERAEELERMREHVIREADVNKDGLISYEEFLNESKKAEFEKDPGWEPLDEQQLYSEQEYAEYKRQKAAEIERAISQGMLQESHSAGQQQAGHQQFPPDPNQIHPNYIHHQQQQQQQQQYQQLPVHQQQQQQQQHYPQQGQYVNQMPPQQGQYNQIPQHQAQYINQPPPQQVQYNQMPNQQQQQQQHHQQEQQQQQQQQFHPNQQVPNTNHINQAPLQQQQQQQFHPNQQVPNTNHINQAPPQQHQQQQQQFHQNQQVPPQQDQFQQPPVVPNPNQMQREQFNVPSGQQQNQQHIETNSVNQVPQHAQQNNQFPAGGGHVANQQPAGLNQQNTQNHIPQQMHEQISSSNNAQGH